MDDKIRNPASEKTRTADEFREADHIPPEEASAPDGSLETRQVATHKQLMDVLAKLRDGEGTVFGEFEVEGRKYSIVKAAESDLADVAKFEESHYDAGTPYTEKEWRENIFSIGEIFLIRDENGNLIGLTSIVYGRKSNNRIELEDDDAYFSGSVLLPEMRGKGISKQINALREQCAKSKGMKRLFTIVKPDNMRSIKALKKFGFEIIDIKKDMHAKSEHDNGNRCILMKNI